MTKPPLGSTMRLLRPAPNVLGFYDGRVDGVRAWSDEPNWLADGAYARGPEAPKSVLLGAIMRQ